MDVDPARFRQALDNLIANAVGHSPRRTATVSVTARRKGASIVIAVTDEGEGIAAGRHGARIRARACG